MDDQAVKRVLGLPMGPNPVVYEKKSYADTFSEFYQVFGYDNDHKAPTFVEVDKWCLARERSQQMTND